MAVVAFPSWAYNNSGQPAQIVATQAAFDALGGVGTWAKTPYATTVSTAPTDPGFVDTDIRLQQILIETRITNWLLQMGLNIVDDPVLQLRPDVLANDSSLTS